MKPPIKPKQCSQCGKPHTNTISVLCIDCELVMITDFWRTVQAEEGNSSA